MDTAREILAFARHDQLGQRMAAMVGVGVVIVLAAALPPVPATVLASLAFLRLQIQLHRRPLVEVAR
jgi:hypothetical protein